MIDPIEHLARDDKWYLGAGDGTLFAPLFPVWLDAPGFWDEATLYQYPMAPLYTVTVLDEDGHEIVGVAQSRRWTPADLTVTWRFGAGISATEVRTVHPGGVFVSEWRFAAVAPVTVHLVAWTAQDGAAVPQGGTAWNGALAFPRLLDAAGQPPLRVRAELACVGSATSWAASREARSALHPEWRYTPFVEQWRGRALPCVVRDDEAATNGLFYAAVHRALRIDYRGASASFAMKVMAEDASLPVSAPARPVRPSHGTIAGASRRRWHAWFERVPQLRCSDPYLETYYWYRWYGLHLNATAAGHGHHEWPTMCEGIGTLHQPGARGAAAQARELRWLDDPAHARGVLRTILARQRPDGSLPACVGANHLSGTDAVGDWGGALLAVHHARPDAAFVAELLPALGRHADWLVRARDADGTGLFDAGHRAAADGEGRSRTPDPESGGDDASQSAPRLKSVDVTVSAYVLFRTLEQLTAGTGEARKWAKRARRTRDAVRDLMWDAQTGMFSDVHAITKQRTGDRTISCFHPYFTDLVDASHVAGLKQNLLSPRSFWTDFPAPLEPRDTPSSRAEEGHHSDRSGDQRFARTWPMSNSHLVDVLAAASRLGAPTLRKHAGDFIKRFVRMMFHEGDLRRPNCHEHYHAVTGHASVYRGFDDCQHSWVADHIISYVAGVRPHATGVTIDPFPCGLEQLTLSGVRVRGRALEIRIVGDRFTVISGGDRHESTLGEAVELGDG